MVNRRRVLKGGGSLLFGSVLAGCVGGGANAEEANQRIQTAVDTLLKNEERFEGLQNQLRQGETPGSYSAETIRTRVERANESLDQAEEVATEEQLDSITALRQWGEFQIERGQYFAERVSLMNTWNTVSAHLDTQQYQKAQQTLETLRTQLDEVESAQNEVVSSYEKVDQEALEEAGLSPYSQEIENAFSRFESWVDTIESLLDGFEPLFEGFVTYSEAYESVQAERYERAKTEYSEAEVDLAEAQRVFQRLLDQDEKMNALDANLVRLECSASSLSDASGYMQDSIQAYQNGNNTQSEEYAKKAKEAADRCGTSNQ